MQDAGQLAMFETQLTQFGSNGFSDQLHGIATGAVRNGWHNGTVQVTNPDGTGWAAQENIGH